MGSSYCFSFWYHMYGQHVDSLNVIVKTLDVEKKLWTRKRQQVRHEMDHKWFGLSLHCRAGDRRFNLSIFNGAPGQRGAPKDKIEALKDLLYAKKTHKNRNK